MTLVINKPYFCRIWEGEIAGDDLLESVKNVPAHFKTSKENNCDAMVLTCKIDQLKAPAILTIAHNYSRLYADDLTLNGKIGQGDNIKFHIKVKCDDFDSAEALGALTLQALNIHKLIQHTIVKLVQNATDTTQKRKAILIIDFVEDNPELGINDVMLLEEVSQPL